MSKSRTSRRCVICGSVLRLIPVAYGYPTAEAVAAEQRGELVLGGCLLGEPTKVCAVCHEAQRDPQLPPVDLVWPWETDAATASSEISQRRYRSHQFAAVWGHLIGDAIGVPYEFTPPADIGAVELRGFGTHNQPPGTWSDDGALMLGLLDSLTQAGFDPDDQGRRFLEWADRGAYTPDSEGAFDIGGATSRAFALIRGGVPASGAGGTDDRDSGNGSLMRILPLALTDRSLEDVELVDQAHVASRVTHAHPRCQVASALYVLTARRLLHGERDRENALDTSVDALRGVYAGGGDSALGWASALEELVARRSSADLKWGGGFVLDSFWSAWEAVLQGGSYRQTIERAVSYGNDTDTTAAIAGGLAGIYWGLDETTGGIPRKWQSALRGREIVEGILAHMN